MKCPNCGQTVRSKTQCAYCGYRFNRADVKDPHLTKDSMTSPQLSGDNANQAPQDPVSNSSLPLSPGRPQVRRSLEKELAQAEKEAKEAYERSLSTPRPILNSTNDDKQDVIDDLNDEESFKKRADEVLNYPYTSRESSFDNQASTEEEYIVPKTKSFSLGRALWGLLKLLLLLGVFFLLFLYGPQLMGKVKSYLDPMFSKNNSQPVEEITTTSLQTEEASLQKAQDQVTSTEKTSESEKESSQDTRSTTTSAAFEIKDSKVNTTDYPTVKVELKFADSLSKVDQDTFDFKVKYNDTEVSLDDAYALVKKGQTLTLSFIDPALSVIGEDTSKQSLLITADQFSEAIDYEVPSKQAQAEMIDQLNQIVTENFQENEEISLQIQKVGDQAPFVYEDHTVEADRLIAWFILQRTYQLVADETISLDQNIPVKSQLVASGDIGTVAAGERESYTVQELIDLTIQEGDASAMNHLVQLAEGVNRFNYWLKESGYFATRMNAPLAIEEDSYITGAITNTTDLATLLSKLAQNKLVDEEHDELLKTAIHNSPYTEKFPNQSSLITNRYELLTSDTNSQLQHLAGIAQTEEGDFLYIVLTQKFQDAYELAARINGTLDAAFQQLLTGGLEREATETTSPEPTSQEPPVATSVEVPVSSVEQAPATSAEPTDNLYEGKQTENFYWFGDQYRRGTWHQSEDGAWYYY